MCRDEIVFAFFIKTTISGLLSFMLLQKRSKMPLFDPFLTPKNGSKTSIFALFDNSGRFRVYFERFSRFCDFREIPGRFYSGFLEKQEKWHF